LFDEDLQVALRLESIRAVQMSRKKNEVGLAYLVTVFLNVVG